MKTTFKRAISVILALCVLVASATCLMGLSVFAETPYNVAAKSLEGLTTYEQRSERVLFSRQNNTAQGCAWMAFDGTDSTSNNKKWFPNTGSNEWIIIDLNDYYSISQISVSQHTGRYLRYKVYAANVLPGVEYSQTNATAVHDYMKANGTVLVDRSTNTNQGVISNAVSDVKARYVMIDIASSTGGNIVIQEMQIMGVTYVPDHVTNTNGGQPDSTTNVAYNYISSLSTSEEKQAAVLANNVNSPAFPFKAFDGIIAGDSANGNKWFSNGTPSATSPHYLIVDLGDVYNLTGLNITFLEATRDHTYTVHAIKELGDVAYEQSNVAEVRNKIYNDGTLIVAESKHSQSRAYQLSGAQGRYVLVNVTKCGSSQSTNIKELEVFGYSLTSATAKIDEASKTITIPGGLGITVNDLMNGLSVKGNAYVSIEKQGSDVLANGDYILVNHGATYVNQSPAILPGATVYAINFTSPNLALSKPILGHAENNNDGNPSLAVNGNTTSNQWMVSGTQNEVTDKPWVVVDLGDTYNLSSLKPYFASTVGYRFEVYAANEIAATWSEENKIAIGDAMMATSPVLVDDSFTLGGPTVDLSVAARYVLVKFTNRNQNNNTLSLYELEIFGYTFKSNELAINNVNKTISVPYSWGKNVTTDMIASALTVDKALVSFNDAGDALTLTYSKGNTIATKTYTILYPNFTSIAILEDKATDRVIVSNESDGTWGYNAFDGKVNNANANQWYTVDSTGWIIIDLLSVYDISQIDVYARYKDASGNALSTRTYTYDIYALSDLGNVEYSSDNKDAVYAAMKNGTKVVTSAANSSSLSHAVNNAHGRYVMIDITNGTGSINVAEIEIFGYAVVPKEEGVKVDYANKVVTVPFTYAGEFSDANIATLVDFAGNANFTINNGKIVAETMNGNIITFTLAKAAPDGSHVNSVGGKVNFYNADKTLIQVNPGDKVYVSFEYYTTGSMQYRLQFLDNTDTVVFNGFGLPTGRNKFEQIVTVPEDGGVLTPSIVRSGGAKIYVWNIVVKVNGTDVLVAYADTATPSAQFFTKSYVSEALSLNLDKDSFVTKVDLTDIDYEKIDRNIWIGLDSGANSNFPAYATDDVTVSYDYYLSGNATTVQVSNTASATAVGNPIGMYDKTNGVVVGAGHMVGTETYTSKSQYGDSLRNVASIAIRKGSEVYPDYFYVWNKKISSPKHGTITYIENSAFAVNVYNDYTTAYPNRNLITIDGVNPKFTTAGVAIGSELDYIKADAEGILAGDSNGDNVVDIRDLVYLNNEDSTFKDIRAFDVDYSDALKSAVDYEYIRKQIWGTK